MSTLPSPREAITYQSPDWWQRLLFSSSEDNKATSSTMTGSTALEFLEPQH